MSFNIKNLTIKNIRSIEDVYLEIDDYNGIIRIGGRNGQGKSTGFYIGLYALCGLVPAYSIKTNGREEALYQIENGYGKFGFVVKGRKVTYYYILNTGEKDSSDASINKNKCLDVVRAYLGFNIDTEFKAVLDLNSKDMLNFVMTNGRTGLEFLRDLVNSEEIEDIQQTALEDEKQLKRELDTTSTKIGVVNKELYEINTIDENWLKQAINWLYSAENTIKSCKNLKGKLINIEKIKLNLLKQNKELFRIKTSLLFKLTAKLNNNQMKYDLLELNMARNEAKNAVNKLDMIYKLNSLYKKKNLLEKLPTLIKSKSSLGNISNLLKNYNKSGLNREVLLIKSADTSIGSFTKDINRLKILNNRKSILSLENVKYKSKDYLITLKTVNKNNLKITTIESNITKAILNSFDDKLVSERRLFIENSKTRILVLLKGMSELNSGIEMKSNINKELEEKIFEDGRCILCYSKKQ